MNSIKRSFFAVVLSLFFFCLPQAAMAAQSNFLDAIQECITITGGSFTVDVTGAVPTSTTISSAIVSLDPSSTTGTVNQIKITSNGSTIFQCGPAMVSNGVDLIQECAQGPVDLPAGTYTYQANGSGFNPLNSTFCVDLE